jgi:hypothetical protein
VIAHIFIYGVTAFAIGGVITVMVMVMLAPERCKHGFLNCWDCNVLNGRKANLK